MRMGPRTHDIQGVIEGKGIRMSQIDMSRRNFVKGAGIATAAAGMTALAGAALADEAPASESGSYTYADTIEWAAEYDVVVLGMGFSGMVSAMSAADAGASVLLCEKEADGEAGGNSRICGQGFAWAHGDEKGAVAYYRALAGGRSVPDDIIETLGRGVARTGDIVASFGLDQSQFTDATLPGICPEYPEFEGGENITQSYAHEGSSDAFLYQHIRSRIAGEYAGRIDVWYGTPATSLIQEPDQKTVIGVTVDRGGEARNVRALNGVCVCTGGFENDPEMVQTYLGVINYNPIGTLSNTGDGIKMCLAVGAKLWHMTSYEGGFGLLGCGYPIEEGKQAASALIATFAQNEMNTGATVVVGGWGKRFGDESITPRHGHMGDGNGIWENPRYPEKMWIIWDATQMAAIDEAGIFNEDYRDAVIKCPTIADIVVATGMHEDVLTKTLDDFNGYAESGDDKEFGRAAEYMRAFDGAGYFVMPVKNEILNTQGGPERNANAEILDAAGNPIPHLYSAGEMGGSTACMYQSGSNVAECLIFGQIAGANAAAPKDPLPAFAAPGYVESSPAHVGDETDLTADSE